MSTTFTVLSPSDLNDLLDFSIKLARTAGQVILEGSRSIRQELATNASNKSAVDVKKNSVDLVTEWDVKVEDLVRREISTRYPTFGLYVELGDSRMC